VAQPHRAGTRVVLAELGSLSMEFTRLAQLTGEHKYYDAIARITDELEKMQNNTRLPGMWPLTIDASGCAPVDISSSNRPSRTEKFPSNKASGLGIAKSSPTITLEKHLPIPKDMEKRDSGLESDAEPAEYETETTKATTPLTSVTASKEVCKKQGLTSPPNAAFDKFGLGGQSDSTYEYLPKEHMLLGGLDDQYRRLYEISMGPVRDKLIFRPMLPDEDRDIRFVSTIQISSQPRGLKDDDDRNFKYAYEGTHLTCFAGGMFAVGAKLFGLDDDMDIAAKLTDGCVWAYESTATGIMPEGFELLPCDDPIACSWNETKYLDAMDPNEKSRVIQAEKSYERQLLRAKEAYLGITHEKKPSHPKKPHIVAPVRSSVGEKSEATHEESYAGIANIAKRGLDDYDEHAHLSTSKTSVVQEEAPKSVLDIDDPDFVAPPKPTVLSHADYVASKLEEERIPVGYTKIQSRKYILRPEAIESVFIMFRLTGDNIWREKGWGMFEAISQHCRTELADSAISDVTSKAPDLLDEMESFWLAETLKYFYLLFSEPSVVNLDEYVL
jgi:mannosyl-oligosaccharide alpha-1,2-mannosidase